nr:hydroxyisourate hydrolase [Jiangella mangrovi]
MSTHVLDTASGRPAAGLRVTLETRAGDPLGDGVTNADGRVAALGPDRLDPGDYVLRFATATPFYPEVVVVFTVADADAHYHVPLLLSPYGYTTYRGS